MKKSAKKSKIISDFDFEYHMKLAQNGDNKSYEKILRNILPIIKSFIRKFDYKNLLDVDSIAQESLIAIHKSSHTYNSQRPFTTWALAIAKFKLKDELRKIYRQKKLTQISFENVEHFLFEEVDFTFKEEPDLDKIIQILKPKQQQIIRYLKIEGNSLQEVANKMNMSVSAVKISAHRSYKILKEKFSKIDE